MSAVTASLIAVAAAILSTSVSHVFQQRRERWQARVRRDERLAEAGEARSERLAQQRLPVYVELLGWIEPLVKDLDRPSADRDLAPPFALHAQVDVVGSRAVRQRFEAMRVSLGKIQEMRRQLGDPQGRDAGLTRMLLDELEVVREDIELLRELCRADLQAGSDVTRV